MWEATAGGSALAGRNSASMCNQGIKGGDRISTDLVVGREVSNRTQSIYMEFLCVTDWDKVKISL